MDTVFFKSANGGAFIHILTPRQSTKSEVNISEHLLEGEPGSLRETLRMTDAVKADVCSRGDLEQCGPKAEKAPRAVSNDRSLIVAIPTEIPNGKLFLAAVIFSAKCHLF